LRIEGQVTTAGERIGIERPLPTAIDPAGRADVKLGHSSCNENKPERRGKQIGMDWTGQRPRDTAAPPTPEAMRHPGFDIPRKTSAA
jgi:hypothetical protein